VRMYKTGKSDWLKLVLLAVMVSITISFHYHGLRHGDNVLSGLFRQFCYIPILLAGLWFGLRGGLAAAGVIVVAVSPNLLFVELSSTRLIREGLEYFYYFLFGGIFGYLVDRERRAQRMRRELVEKMARLEHLSAIGEMAAGLAHEIKNPMGSIKGAADIIEPEISADHPKREFVDIMREEVGRLNRVIENFLKLARPMELKYRDVALKKLLDSVVRQLDLDNRAPGVDVTLDVPESLVIRADEERLRQVFLNLALNAVQATEGRGKLDITAFAEKSGDVHIRFSDNGPGVPEEMTRRLFMPFYTGKSDGSGLGLSISERIIAEHGGRIDVLNSPEGGAIFEVVIPVSGRSDY